MNVKCKNCYYGEVMDFSEKKEVRTLITEDAS